MATIIKQLRTTSSSQGSDNPKRSRDYLLCGTTSITVAEDDFDAYLATNDGSLVLGAWSVDRKSNSDTHYECSAEWVKFKPTPKPEPPETGTEKISFNISTTTQHITQSKETIARFGKPGKTPPNHRGAIGVSGDEVKGTDILTPVVEFTIVKYQPIALITNAYVQQLGDTVSHTNSVDFRGWQPGEVLFIGCAGSPRSSLDYQMSYTFAAAKNLLDFDIGTIVEIARKAHEHHWVEYEQVDDPASKAVTLQPFAVHVERVYDGANFATNLGIGT